jgi:hypothetical protein
MTPGVGRSGTCALGRTSGPRLVCEAPPELVEPRQKMFDGPRPPRPCLQSQVASAFVDLGSRPIISQHTAVSREMSLVGQSRRFRDAPEESGSTPITDMRRQHLRLVGVTVSAATVSADHHRPDVPTDKA